MLAPKHKMRTRMPHSPAVWSNFSITTGRRPRRSLVIYRPMFGSFGSVPASTSISFVSQAAFASGIASKLGLRSIVAPVQQLPQNRGKTNDPE